MYNILNVAFNIKRHQNLIHQSFFPKVLLDLNLKRDVKRVAIANIPNLTSAKESVAFQIHFPTGSGIHEAELQQDISPQLQQLKLVARPFSPSV